MSCKNLHCITVSGTTNEEIWREIRLIVGGTNVTSSGAINLMNSEIADYNGWVATIFVADPSKVPATFDKWLIWRINVGTTVFGNLPKDKKHDGKVGHCYMPCPHSTQGSDARSRSLLGLSDSDPLPYTRKAHVDGEITYYMSTASRGSYWGFECTYSGCPYIEDVENYGLKYFYT